MAGPAIRAFEMAKAIARVAEVRLVSTSSSSMIRTDFDVLLSRTERELREHERWSDVVIFQGHFLQAHPWMIQSDRVIVADIYDPMHLEQLEQGKDLPGMDQFAEASHVTRVLNDQIERADFMLCASEKQRDFWLGQLAGVGRINPATYEQDASLRSLLAVVPFGVADDAPVQRAHGIKGVVPGIGAQDKVIIWGGGIYNWFDPLTLIHAVHNLSLRRADVRLFFLGVKHPNPDVATMRMAFDAQELARQLGLLDTVVFFNEGWVPYEQRADYLLDGDVGVSTHLDHLETAFSFRTRILDYLWASLPVVSTAGDTFAALIAEHSLGRVVPPSDVAALEVALEELLYDDEERRSIASKVGVFAQTMTWSRSLSPLIDFCLAPTRAADLQRGILSLRLADLDELRRRVEGVEASNSWKLTKPFRALSTASQRVLRKLR